MRAVAALLLALAIATLVAACQDESAPTPSPAPTATPPSNATPVSPTPTSPAPTPEPPIKTAVPDIDSDTLWHEVFDALPASEQSCIRDEIGEELLASALEMRYLDDGDTEEWHVSFFSCIAPDTARAIFLATQVAGMAVDQGVDLTDDHRSCLEDWLAGFDVPALMASTLPGAEEEAALDEFMVGFLGCVPELLLSGVLEGFGMELEDLSEGEASCLRQWASTGIDWEAVAAEDDAAAAEILAEFAGCAPDLFLAAVMEEVGMRLEDLGEDELSCVRQWVRTDIDWDALAAADDDPASYATFLPFPVRCVPDLLIASIVEEWGAEAEDLSEDEASCLRQWVTGIDWDVLAASGGAISAADPRLLEGFVDCAPDLFLASLLGEWGVELAGLSEDEWACMRQWATGIGAADRDGFSYQMELGVVPLKCVPRLLVAGITYDDAFDLPDLTEGEEGCLETVLVGADLALLVSLFLHLGALPGQIEEVPGDVLALAQSLQGCAPDLLGWYAFTALDDHGDGVDDATSLAVGESTSGVLHDAYDADYFAFEASEGELYQIDVSSTALSSVSLSLFDTNGRQDIPYHSYAQNGREGVLWEIDAPGLHHVRVGSPDTGSYTLTVSVAEFEDDHGDGIEDATAVAVNAEVPGAMNHEHDADYFAFEAVGGAYHRIRVELETLSDNLSAASLDLDLYDSEGVHLQSADPFSDDAAAVILWLAPASGTYYASVSDWWWFRAGHGSYTLSVSPIEDDHGNRREDATPIAAGTDTAGTIGHEEDADYFALEATEGQTYSIEASGTADDGWLDLRLYDSGGEYVDSSSFFGPLEWQAPSSGAYYVRLSGRGYIGPYTLSLLEVDDPADARRIDRAALVALYEATDGANWKNNTNWLSDAPLGEWYAVATDSDGRVTFLSLNFNQLSGHLPAELGSLSNLSILSLNGNQLSGHIPAELGSLANLEYLSLIINDLSGEVPAELGSLSNLRWLGLYRNRLSGMLPQSLTGLTALGQFYFSDNAGLCAPVDDAFQAWLQGIPGAEGSSCAPKDSVEDRAVLVTFYNATDGANWEDNTNWLSDRPIREWHGVISDASGRVTGLDLFSNRLSGEIPSALGDLANLKDLDLGFNGLSGEIPAELGSLANLRDLDLGYNELSGEIPAELGSLTNLRVLDVGVNELSGAVPAELGKLANLVRLQLHRNQLSGCVPGNLRDQLGMEGSNLGELQFCDATAST